MFGPWAPNGYLLASIPPLSDIYIYFFIYLLALPSRQYSFGLAARSPPYSDIPSALLPCLPLMAIFLWPCSLAHPSRRYSFSLAASLAPSRRYSFGLAALLAPHGDIPLALRQCPLTTKSIFYSPHGKCRFYFLMPPHSKIDFLFASVVFITLPPPRGVISFAPHDANQFSLWLILPKR